MPESRVGTAHVIDGPYPLIEDAGNAHPYDYSPKFLITLSRRPDCPRVCAPSSQTTRRAAHGHSPTPAGPLPPIAGSPSSALIVGVVGSWLGCHLPVRLSIHTLPRPAPAHHSHATGPIQVSDHASTQLDPGLPNRSCRKTFPPAALPLTASCAPRAGRNVL